MEIEKHRYGPPSDVWWDVAAAEVSGDSVTQEARRIRIGTSEVAELLILVRNTSIESIV